jgi:hypothetical protein
MTNDRSIEEPCEVTSLTHGFGAERRGRPLRLGVKVTRNHRIFPSDEAVYKVVYLAMHNIAKKWTMPIRNWVPALNCFAIEFGERFPQ